MSYTCCHCGQNGLEPEGPISVMLSHVTEGELKLDTIDLQNNGRLTPESLAQIRVELPQSNQKDHVISLYSPGKIGGSRASFSFINYQLTLPAEQKGEPEKGQITICCDYCGYCCDYKY